MTTAGLLLFLVLLSLFLLKHTSIIFLISFFSTFGVILPGPPPTSPQEENATDFSLII